MSFYTEAFLTRVLENIQFSIVLARSPVVTVSKPSLAASVHREVFVIKREGQVNIYYCLVAEPKSFSSLPGLVLSSRANCISSLPNSWSEVLYSWFTVGSFAHPCVEKYRAWVHQGGRILPSCGSSLYAPQTPLHRDDFGINLTRLADLVQVQSQKTSTNNSEGLLTIYKSKCLHHRGTKRIKPILLEYDKLPTL